MTKSKSKSKAQVKTEAARRGGVVGNAGKTGGSATLIYLREIGRTGRLTREEERELGRRVRGGDDEARTRMIQSNLRLVAKIAKDYSGRGIDFLDLVSEGNIGLMKAVDRYDPERGVKFSTYAAWWIKNGMRRALATSSTVVRVPENMANRAFKLHREEDIFGGELGR